MDTFCHPGQGEYTVRAFGIVEAGVGSQVAKKAVSVRVLVGVEVEVDQVEPERLK
jgi:hypothetical protein